MKTEFRSKILSKLVNKLTRAPGDAMLWLQEKQHGGRVPPQSVYKGRVPNRPELRLWMNPYFGPEEGSQSGRNIILGQGMEPEVLAHEVEHANQGRRWGPLFDAIYKHHERRLAKPSGGTPYLDNPFEKAGYAAGKREHQRIRSKEKRLGN